MDFFSIKKSYLIFTLFTCLILFSLPQKIFNKVRMKCIEKMYMANKPNPVDVGNDISHVQTKISEMEKQIEAFSEWLLFEDRVQEKMDIVRGISLSEKNGEWNDFFVRKNEQIRKDLFVRFQAVFAKVIYRDMGYWSRFLWIDKGEKDNQALGRCIIGKNSPVLIGDILVGVVEEVGKKISKIRLITDSDLHVAVQTQKGGDLESRIIREHVLHLEKLLQKREDYFSSPEEQQMLRASLEKIKNKTRFCANPLIFAQVHGKTDKGVFSQTGKLAGTAFITDDKNVLDKSSTSIQPGALLFTSGLDGVFPEGLQVGIVRKMTKEQKGEETALLEADSCLNNFSRIGWVCILPPQDYSQEKSMP